MEMHTSGFSRGDFGAGPAGLTRRGQFSLAQFFVDQAAEGRVMGPSVSALLRPMLSGPHRYDMAL